MNQDEFITEMILAGFTHSQRMVLLKIMKYSMDRIMQLANAILGDLKEEDKNA